MKRPLGQILCMGRTGITLAPGPRANRESGRPLLPLGDGLGTVGDVGLWLAREEVPVRLLGRVGDDDQGRDLRARLTSAGADTSLLAEAPGEPTGLTVIGEKHREYPGADEVLPPAAGTRETFEEVALCHLSLSTFAPKSTRDGWLRALDLAREAGAKVAIRADFAARPGWSRYEAQGVLTDGMDPVDLLWTFGPEVSRLFPEFWSDAAMLEGLEELGATRTVLIGADGGVLVLEPGEEPRVIGHVNVDDPRVPSAFEALVLARWDRGHELGPALEAACHRISDRLLETTLDGPLPPEADID